MRRGTSRKTLSFSGTVGLHKFSVVYRDWISEHPNILEKYLFDEYDKQRRLKG